MYVYTYIYLLNTLYEAYCTRVVRVVMWRSTHTAFVQHNYLLLPPTPLPCFAI